MTSRSSLVDPRFVRRVLVHEAAWHQSHGARDGFLGTGMLYYALTYTLRVRVAVCLGSGGGFVPRLMRQAQRDLGIAAGSRTILVDADRPEAGWGEPLWRGERSFFRRRFPDVEVRVETTQAAAAYFRAHGIRIDYLHIDADHSYDACLADFLTYRAFMSPRFVVTLHDSDMPAVARVLAHVRACGDYEVIDFPDAGRGVAIVKPRQAHDAPKRYAADASPQAPAPGWRKRAARRALAALARPRPRAALGALEWRWVRRFTVPQWAPIFVIGPARSGTTLIYQCLVQAFELAYLSNAMVAVPASPALVGSALAPLGGCTPRAGDFTSRYGATRGWSGPSQAHQVWSRWFPSAGERTVSLPWSADERRALVGMVAALEHAYRAPFVNKWPAHGLHLIALDTAFPRALFVRVRRDLERTAQSVLRMRIVYGEDRYRSVSRVPSRYDDFRGDGYVGEACGYVLGVEEDIERGLAVLGSERCFTLEYEDFCASPRERLAAFARWYAQHGGRALRSRAQVPERFAPPSAPVVDAVDAEAIARYLRTHAPGWAGHAG